MTGTIETIDALIFYFDLIGVVDQYISAPQDTLARLRAFHARARATFPLGGPHSTIKTLADNVWARINASEQIAELTTFRLAATAMVAAEEFGFPKYFGVITRGEHTFDLVDRTIVSGADATDFLIQHIDMTSEPHMRAALAEKWSAHLARAKESPVPVQSVWVGEEVFEKDELEDRLCGQTLPFVIRPERFDLKDLAGPPGKTWPFEQSAFRGIALR